MTLWGRIAKEMVSKRSTRRASNATFTVQFEMSVESDLVLSVFQAAVPQNGTILH